MNKLDRERDVKNWIKELKKWERLYESRLKWIKLQIKKSEIKK